uniref:Uncharacterized protein n=1 Tax=Anguilla anguilla TaxID=7936 RepID=A0A0E9T0V7_ANGAN
MIWSCTSSPQPTIYGARNANNSVCNSRMVCFCTAYMMTPGLTFIKQSLSRSGDQGSVYPFSS